MKTRMQPMGMRGRNYRASYVTSRLISAKTSDSRWSGPTPNWIVKSLIWSKILSHLIRNCADHGIENPDQRSAAGKPRRGTID